MMLKLRGNASYTLSRKSISNSVGLTTLIAHEELPRRGEELQNGGEACQEMTKATSAPVEVIDTLDKRQSRLSAEEGNGAFHARQCRPPYTKPVSPSPTYNGHCSSLKVTTGKLRMRVAKDIPGNARSSEALAASFQRCMSP